MWGVVKVLVTGRLFSAGSTLGYIVIYFSKHVTVH